METSVSPSRPHVCASRQAVREARIATFKRRRLREELANSLTHGAGLLLSIGGLVALLIVAVTEGGPLEIACAAVYGASLVLLYGSSTIYHAATHRKWRRWFGLLDHCAIYILIAGSYTPFALLALRGGLGWTVFGVVWGLALLGIAGKVMVTHAPSVRSTLLYAGMGWMSVLVIWPLFKALGGWSFGLLIAGGVAYSLGTIFFTLDRRPYFHAIWHLFVLAGSVLHFAAIFLHVFPLV